MLSTSDVLDCEWWSRSAGLGPVDPATVDEIVVEVARERLDKFSPLLAGVVR